MHWKAIYTKPRHEKKVAKLLENKGIEVYCPLQEVVRQWSDRKKKIKDPLFKSYVFVRCHDAEELSVLQTAGVVAFVRYLRKVATIRDSEIQAIREFLSGYENVRIEQLSDWKVGDSVEVTEGSMKGRTGEIAGFQGSKARLVIAELGLQLIAEVPLGQLEKLGLKEV
jgi:transcription antitermination factor NusG